MAWEGQVDDLAHLYGWTVAGFRSVKVQRSDGSWYWVTPVQADGKGWPDKVLVRATRILFRELKTGKGRLTKEQRTWRDLLKLAGCDYAIWRPEDLPSIIEELRKH